MIINTALIVGLMLSVSAVNAATVTVDFTGTIDGRGGLTSDLHTLIPIGQAFTGSYTYETESPSSPLSNSDISYLGAISNFTVSFGDLYATLDNGAFRFQDNKELQPFFPEDEPTIYDTYIVQGTTESTAIPTNVETNIVLSDYSSSSVTSAYHLNWMRLDVNDFSAEMLSNALLTNQVPDISNLDMGFQFGYRLDCCTGSTDVYGSIDSLTVSAVPVLPALWLFVSGLFGLFLNAKRKSS